MKSRLYRNGDWLYQKYWGEKLTTRKIAEECQIHRSTISSWIRKFGIETHCENNPWHDADKLYEEHVLHGKSIIQITREWDAGKNTISKWLKRHNIPITRLCGRDVTGCKNPRWNEGVSEYPNHALFKKNRILALERADGKCEICKKEASVAHHVDGSTNNHELNNLIVLCSGCHGMLHRRRKWTDYVHQYGMTAKELATYFGVSPKVIRGWNRSFLGKQKLLSANL